MIGILKKKKRNNTNKLVNKIFVFAKAQVSAFIGGLTDYAIMVFITEVFHVHYTISIAIGGIIGAVVNFSLNRKWTFRSKDLPYKNSINLQLIKFILVVINSIVLKSSGTYFITTFLRIDYKISRIFVDLFVSIALNYTLQKNWVFKNSNKTINKGLPLITGTTGMDQKLHESWDENLVKQSLKLLWNNTKRKKNELSI